MRTCCYLVILFLVSCTRAVLYEDVTVNLNPPQGAVTRSADPDEKLLTDYNLYIFNQFGLLEKRLYVSAREFQPGATSCTARLLKDAPYVVLAAANIGYELRFDSLEEALQYRYHMAYPDEFSQGIPMAACMKAAVAGDEARIDVPLERLMSRVDLSIDRRSLNEDVSIRVTCVRICNSASSVLLFGDSTVDNWSQLFTDGYTKSDSQVYWLNHDTLAGTSGEVPFYLLENRQDGIAQSYIEVYADYHSASAHTRPGESLIYRFWLTPDHDACRNTRYHLCLKPQGTGLECPDGWKLDKTWLITD